MVFQSLTFKWIATLLLTSLVGVVIVGLFAYRTTVNEFDRFRIEQAQESFLNDVTLYYERNVSWSGVNDALRQVKPAQLVQQQQHTGMLFQLFALADKNGRVLIGAGPFRLNDMVPPQDLEQGIPIVVKDRQVGTLLLAAPPPGLDPRQQEYLNRTNQALLLGGIGAAALAVFIGLLLSRHFLHPLTDLTHAIRAMRHGELAQQVPVRTRDELGELAGAFNQMSADIHRANQLRKQMTADIAHDLRTPLAVITGYLEGLRDGTLKATPERFDVMYEETVLLKRLIDDLRTLSLADAGELTLSYQAVQPRELLTQIQHSFEPLAASQDITLKVDAAETLPALRIDYDRMVQVLGNLVSNALRYTPTGGSITLSATAHQAAIQLAVTDTGKGIPADKLPNIFDRFYRVEESRYQSEGESGLGLAIAKSIVEAHHGTISAVSQVGSGTSVLLTLPAA